MFASRLSAALFALASALSGRRRPKGEALRETRPEDFAKRGLAAEVAPWEDGYRSPRTGANYEWWYFDALLDDGTTVVVWFGENWPPGKKGWQVSLDITPPQDSGRPETREVYDQVKPDAVSETTADVRIKTHLFAGDLERYHIVVDPALCGGAGVDLWLTRRAPPWRPGTGYYGDGEDYFAWVVPVPEGKVEGSVTENGVARTVAGSGYHDHNFGDVPPNQLIAAWWWGRAKIGEDTVIIADLKAARAYGGESAPALLVTGPHGEKASLAEKTDLTIEYGPPGPSLDPRHPKPLGSGLTLKGRTAPVSVSARHEGKLIASEDLLLEVSWPQRFFARLIGVAPWYTRLLAAYALRLNGAETKGAGTLEYMDFDEK